MVQDLRQACRFFARRRTVAALCVLTLALGIAAFTTVISIADALLWHPLPYRQADRLVRIREYIPTQHSAAVTVPLDMLRQWDASTSLFDSVDPYYMRTAWLRGGSGSDVVTGAVVSSTLFTTLGVAPQLGRAPAAGDHDWVMISDSLWRSRFAGDPAVIGTTLAVDDRVFTVTGVMPPAFSFPVRNVRIWIPLTAGTLQAPMTTTGAPLAPAPRVQVLARLKPGVTIASARAAADATVHGDQPGVEVTPFAIIIPSIRTEFFAFLAAVLLVLLIAVGNAGNILLGEAVRRDSEIAIRRSLGASTWRLARQLLMESLLISAAAAACGILAAIWLIPLAASGLPSAASMLSLSPLALDWRAAALAIAAAGAAGTFAGLVPLWRARSRDAQPGLRQSAQTAAPHHPLRAVLLIAELTLSIVVLVAAALLGNSFLRLATQKVAYDAAHVMTFRLYLPAEHFADDGARSRFLGQVRNAAASLPDVRDVSITDGLPPFTNFSRGRIETTGGGTLSGEVTISVTHVDDEFLATLGLPLIEGHDIGHGAPTTAGGVLVSRSFADRLGSRGDPIGTQFRWDPADPWLTVAGIVPDVENGTFTSRLGTLAVYEPLSMRGAAAWTQPMLVVRTPGLPEAVAPEIERLIRRMDPEVPAVHAESATEMAAERRAEPRFAALLMLMVAGLALLLAIAGVYGVFSTAALQRTREFGVRLALGATPDSLVKMMMGEAGRLVLVALVFGTAAAAATTRLLEGLLYRTSPLDLWSFAAAASLLCATALGATALAVRAASRIPPMEALRAE